MRPSRDETGMAAARVWARRATCIRRQVGCVLVDQHGYVLATGYNGNPSGFPHCVDVPCPGANMRSGTGLDLCQAIHAEQNALLQCRDVHAINTAYCTTAPCVTCTKLLLNTSCRRILFDEDYPHSEAAMKLWRAASRKWLWIGSDG